MVEAFWLETRRTGTELTPEFTFPKRDPRLDHAILVRRRTKKMNVIRHDDVSADHPSIGCAPCFHQCIVNGRIREQGLPLSRANRDENDRGPIEENEYASRGMMALF